MQIIYISTQAFKCSRKPKTNEYNFLLALRAKYNNIQYNPYGPFKLKSLGKVCAVYVVASAKQLNFSFKYFIIRKS